MKEAVDGITSVVEKLNERLLELEMRVSALEGRPEKAKPSQTPPVVSEAKGTRPPATWRGFPPPETPSELQVIGKAVLGIAGAYLLRAITESGSLPKLPVIMVAIVYACSWMVWGFRYHAKNGFASVTYGITSALILSPLLWESTVRFHILSTAFTGTVLVVFVGLALALSRRHGLQVISWVAMLAAVNTALALIVATHELVPLTATLLAVALVTEIAICLGCQLSLRVVPAIAADLAIVLLVDLMTSPEGIPEGYHAAAPVTITTLCLALLAIYGGSIGIRGYWLRQRISIFEMGQGVLAFVLATYGAMRATHGSAAVPIGCLFLLLAAVCYWGALSRFAEEAYLRNRLVSVTWAAALLLGGSVLVFPASFQVLFLSVAGVAAVCLYKRTGSMSLAVHASVFLTAAAAISSLPIYVVSSLSGTVPTAPHWGVWVVAVSAALCYAIGSRGVEDRTASRLLWIVPAVLIGFTGAAMAVAAIVWLASHQVDLAASRLSVIRTMVICVLALGLGFLAARWKRLELRWVAYAAVAFGTLKLVFEDLRFGNAASMVVSLLFYGLILILLPRLVQRSRIET